MRAKPVKLDSGFRRNDETVRLPALDEQAIKRLAAAPRASHLV